LEKKLHGYLKIKDIVLFVIETNYSTNAPFYFCCFILNKTKAAKPNIWIYLRIYWQIRIHLA